MSEGEVVEQLIGYMGLLLVGVSLIFTVVSAYIVALNYFVGEAMLIARVGAFAFVALILALLLVVMIGAENAHSGLIGRLIELEAAGQLTAAGRAPLENARGGIDWIVRSLLWIGMISVYGVLAYMTFIHRWKPDVVNVQLQSRKAS
ncbi:MAG TPA: hypothetical protein VEA80_08385 [Vitreimonas sp.]|uniref:hypothetical protein n=1 Tax=Vitreimonas sp. TaxID=3069702 RepID=UPI002D517766|nr:hypothetical protein [Vitreimonas sp.]HYD87476.1 hypothetical protein [Vitreimonas sp.]